MKLQLLIRGGKFDQRLKLAKEANALIPGAGVLLEREPSNAFDKNAIKALVEQFVGDPKDPGAYRLFSIGYVAREAAHSLAPELDKDPTRPYHCTLLSWDDSTCMVQFEWEIKGEPEAA